MARRLICTEGGASKFWEAEVKGSSLTVRFGKIGTAGQTKVKNGVSPDDWSEGANCGHGYVVRFPTAPDARARAAVEKAFKTKLARTLVDTSCGPWKWKDAWALFAAGENHAPSDDGDEDFDYVLFFRLIREAFCAAHEAVPLAEVVSLNARSPSGGDWERWTLQVQPRPTAWPDFNRVALFFRP